MTDERSHAPLGVAIAAYRMSPERGSEAGFSWRLVEGLARRGVRVHAVTTARYQDEWDTGRLDRLGITTHLVSDQIPRHLRRGHLGVYLPYLSWQRRSVPVVHDLVGSEQVDLVHHYSWAALNFGTPLARLQAPLVVGPLGGGAVMHKASRKELLPRDRIFEAARSIAVSAGRTNPRIRSLKRHADALLTTNKDTEQMLRGSLAPVIPMLDTHLDDHHLANAPRHRRKVDSPHNQTRVVWLGRLLPRKGLMLALEAISHVRGNVHLTVIGDGPEAHRAHQRLAHDTALSERVTMLGQQPWKAVIDHLNAADLFLFTSYRDAFGSQVLEAASRGLPVIGLDHQGVRDFFPKAAGALVDPEPFGTLPERLANEIERLSSDHDLFRSASDASLAFARRHSTSAFVDSLISIYETTLNRASGASVPASQ